MDLRLALKAGALFRLMSSLNELHLDEVLFKKVKESARDKLTMECAEMLTQPKTLRLVATCAGTKVSSGLIDAGDSGSTCGVL